MVEADRLTIAGGMPGIELMEAAGRAVAAAAASEYPDVQSILIATGPGNNGGDGYVAARCLAETGRKVTLASLVPAAALKGDAASAAQAWAGKVINLGDADPTSAGLVIDGLFGTGLTRPVAGAAAAFLERVTACGVPVLAIDVPSGVDGTTGEVRGPAPIADVTVAFFRPKTGHYLLPGKRHVGRLLVRQIGMPASILDQVQPNSALNCPELWGGQFPWPDAAAHKYSRGHALVLSGPMQHTGAARLAARAALRVGAGLVTLASPPNAVMVNASQLTAIMVRTCGKPEELADLLADKRYTALAMGPGAGVGEGTRSLAATALASGANIVLDADALTSFEGAPETLFGAIAGHMGATVMTPHEGEFKRLFKDVEGVSKLGRARAAAKRSGAIVVLKGPDTVIAAPDGRAAINANARPWLATAGSGDVLAGLITGLLAQGMPAFEAASAGVWLHGEAGQGPGLIAEDLTEAMPEVLARLLSDPIEKAE